MGNLLIFIHFTFCAEYGSMKDKKQSSEWVSAAEINN